MGISYTTIKTLKKINGNEPVMGNDGGFVLIVTLVTLMLLIVLGVSTTTTTNIELQIAGNDKVNKINFYVAEGTSYEAAQLLEDNNAIIGIATAASGTGSTYTIIDNGIAKGGSLSVIQSQVHIYSVTGSASNNNSNNSVDIGYKKRF